MAPGADQRLPLAGDARFHTTQWTLVLRAGDSADPGSQEALADLCERYWYPVYAFVRRRGAAPEDAQDLVQGFFSHLLERRTLKVADPERGRFRSFLLGSAKLYLSDERRRAAAGKRGGAAPAIDLETAEQRYRLETDPEASPERLYERRWALELLAHTRARLAREVERSAHPERTRLLGFLTEGGGPRYQELAAELGMNEGAVKVAVHRLRRRFGTLLREEVARTVGDPARVDEELRHLLAILG